MSDTPVPEPQSPSSAGMQDDEERIVARKPSLRAMILTEDVDFAVDLAYLFAHSQRVDVVGEVRQDEYDIVISTEEFLRDFYRSAGPSRDLSQHDTFSS